MAEQVNGESAVDAADRTVIGHSTADKLVLFGGFPLAGLALGFFLPRIADWAATQDWMPWEDVVRLVSRWDAWWVVLIFTAIGLVAGIILAVLALEESLRITVSDREVEFLKKRSTSTVPRDRVAAAFLDGREVVLQDATSAELARERHDELSAAPGKIGAAFRAHGYPWREDGDPQADRFRRWVEDDPELPPAVNAVLRARSKAFGAEGGAADLRELRLEVAKLGYVVRDRDKKQYWRSVDR